MGLDYNRCTRDELQRFVKARIGSAADTSEEAYIELLRQADRDATFRFLDLPPELRNVVYEELLSGVTTEDKSCWPAILRTSRQINEEATSILYDGAIIDVRLRMCTSWFTRGPSFDVRGTTFLLDDFRAFDNWPAFLLRVRTIRIRIDLEIDPDRARWDMSLNLHLYSLATYLAQSDRLESFELHVEVLPGELCAEIDYGRGQQEVDWVLWPIVRLAGVDNWWLEGLSEQPRARLLDQMWSWSGPTCWALKEYRVLIRRARAVFEIANSLSYPITAVHNECVWTLVQMLDFDNEPIDVERDRALVESGEAVEQMLTGGLIDNLMEMAQTEVDTITEQLQASINTQHELQRAKPDELVKKTAQAPHDTVTEQMLAIAHAKGDSQRSKMAALVRLQEKLEACRSVWYLGDERPWYCPSNMYFP